MAKTGMTEKKEEYDRLVAQKYEHIVFTDRLVVPDCIPIPETLKVAQVQGFKEKKDETWSVITSSIPCSCPSCRNDPTQTDSCQFKDDRNVREHNIRDKNSKDKEPDPYGIRKLTCALLRVELKERQLPVTGLKPALVARLEASIEDEGDEQDHIMNSDEDVNNESVDIGDNGAEM